MMMSAERLALAEELLEVIQQLEQLLGEEGAEPGVLTVEVLQNLGEEYERLAMLLEMYGWQEILPVVEWMRATLAKPASAEVAARGGFLSWLSLTAQALQEQDSDNTYLAGVTQALMADYWPDALPMAILQDFLLSFNTVDSGQHEVETAVVLEKKPDSSEAAFEEANALRFREDVHPELVQAYMEETPLQVTQAAALIRELVAKNTTGNIENQTQAVRLVHTIKGSSGVVGLEPVSRLAHSLEDLLEAPAPYPEEAGDILAASADCLESLLDHVQTDHQLPTNYHHLCAGLNHWAEKLGGDEADSDVDDAGILTNIATKDLLNVETVNEDILSEAALADALIVADDKPSAPVSRSDEKAKSLPGQQSKLEYAGNLLNLSGELITSSSQSGEYLQRCKQLLRQFHQYDAQLEQRLQEMDETIQQFEKQRMERSIDSPELRYTALNDLEQYSEFQGTMNLLIELAADRRELLQELEQQVRQLNDELYQQQRVQRQLSDAVLATRLIAVERVLPRLERIVRETCRETGKQAVLTLHGESVQLDADILQGLLDPLLHLLRNAVDHGIELPEERIQAGKPVQGRITLEIQQQGHQVLVLLSDDGAGLDKQAILTHARSRGLVGEQQQVSEEELFRFVLLPGFSTREAVNLLSGRGVGMDIVRNQIEQLRGHLQISSQTGQGTQVRMTLPQTLVSTQALIVRASGQSLAIPVEQIEQVLHVNAGESYEVDGRWHVRNTQYDLPVKRLAVLLDWPAHEIKLTDPHTILIVRTSQSVQQAIYVDEVLATRDIVVKSLTPWFTIPGIQGACLLANGVVAPVLDIQRLWPYLNEDILHLSTQLEIEMSEQSVTNEAPAPLLLVVDDSLSNRRSMQFMLEGMGYRVKTAVDGMNALQLLHEVVADAVITDLEMPRMNGLEMTQSIRTGTEQQHIPVIMVTSRSTQKYRNLAQQAGVDAYLSKPVPQTLLAQHLQQWLDSPLEIA